MSSGMKARVAVDILSKALKACAGVVSKRSALVEMEGVVIEAKIEPSGGTISVTATDMELGLVFSAPCDVEKAGSVLLPHALFSALVSRLPENVATITGNAKHRVSLVSGTMKADLAGMDPDKMPLMSPPGSGDWSEIPAAMLASMIDQTRAAICREESQPAPMQCLNIVASEGKLTGQTTTGKGASVANFIAPTMKHAANVLLSEKAFTALRNVLDGAATDQPSYVMLTDRIACYKREGLLLTMKLIEGKFPDIAQVIPDTQPFFTMSRARLSETIARLATVGKDDGFLKVKLTADNGVLTATVEDGDRNIASEDLAIQYDGGPQFVRLGTKALGEALRSCQTDNVSLAWTTFEDPKDARPFLIRPENTDSVHLLMPFVN